MPYKSRGKRVLVKRAGRWVVLKIRATQAEAKAHAAALNINAHKGSKKG